MIHRKVIYTKQNKWQHKYFILTNKALLAFVMSKLTIQY